MAIGAVTYQIAPRGLATSFTESELPIDYATDFKNRYINAAGGAEKRQGITQLGDDVPSSPSITGIHELIKADGTAVLLVSGGGSIWKYSDSAGTYSLARSGGTPNAAYTSVQMGDKLIFVNGVDRNIFTEDGDTYEELKAVIERGAADTGTDQTQLVESDIENWITDSNIAINDILYNRTRDAYAVINAIATATVTHTEISSSAAGMGAATSSQAIGDRYELLDSVALNIVPTDGEPDNTATLGTGSSATFVALSAIADWTTTDIRVGDWVRNTTKVALTQVTAVSTAGVGVVGVSGQAVGDSIILLKSAMPIATRAHVHFGRAYYIDSRDQRLVRISGAENPEDMTTDAGTLDSTTFKYGNLQPRGDSILSMESFQRFICFAGKEATYLFSGTVPIADATGDTVDFSIVGVFPKGIVDGRGLVSIGNDLVFITSDGAESVSLVYDASTLGRANLSEALRTTLRDKIKSASNVAAIHYPRRSWLLLKVDSELFVFNYTPYLGQDRLSSSRFGETLDTNAGSWSLFDGTFAQQNVYFVRSDNDLLCAGPNGKVYRFDQKTYDDDGNVYKTLYGSAWLTLDKNNRDIRIKAGRFIKPIIEAGANINYTVKSEAGFEQSTGETITVTTSGGSNVIGIAEVGVAKIGGSKSINEKYPLRWRGEQVRISFETEDSNGPDVISRYTLYATIHGKR